MATPIIINCEPIDIQTLKLAAKKFYSENLQGKTVVNKDRGITVVFSSVGRRHVLYARNAGLEKLVAIFKLPEIVTNAKFTNFKNPDASDPVQVIGFMNFKCPVKINGVLQHFRIVIRINRDGKFFYDHSVKVKK